MNSDAIYTLNSIAADYIVITSREAPRAFALHLSLSVTEEVIQSLNEAAMTLDLDTCQLLMFDQDKCVEYILVLFWSKE